MPSQWPSDFRWASWWAERNIRNTFYPIIRFISPIPGVAWFPWQFCGLGLETVAAIFIIVMGSISPIIVNTFQGMQNVDRRLENVLGIMEASMMQRIRYCVIPSILPMWWQDSVWDWEWPGEW